MANLPEIERADKISRDRWAYVMGQVMIKAISYDVRCAMVAAGFDEFERVARPILADHEFRQEDYKSMYRTMVMHTMPGALQ